MQLDNAVEMIINTLSESLDNTEVIGAYPDRRIAARLDHKAVAVGIDSASLEAVSLDDGTRCGAVALFADIFVPVSMGVNAAHSLFFEIIDALTPYYVLSVKTDRMSIDSKLCAYVMRTSLEFNDKICVGGVAGE